MSEQPLTQSIWSPDVPVVPAQPESSHPSAEVVRAEGELRAIDQLMAELSREFLKEAADAPVAAAPDAAEAAEED